MAGRQRFLNSHFSRRPALRCAPAPSNASPDKVSIFGDSQVVEIQMERKRFVVPLKVNG